MIPLKVDSHCRAKAKNGKRCRAAATKGGLCFFHSNPNKASELGRIGGRSKRIDAAENADPLPVLDNPDALRDTVARLIGEVHAGRLHPRVAASLTPLLNLQLRAIETTNLAQRVVRIEKLLAMSGELDLDTDEALENTPAPPTDEN